MTDYDDTLGELDLAPAVRSGMTLQEIQDRYIVDVLHDCKGNISAAADHLGIFRSSLQRRMQKEPLASKVRSLLAANRAAKAEQLRAKATSLRRRARKLEKRTRPPNTPAPVPGEVFWWRGRPRRTG